MLVHMCGRTSAKHSVRQILICLRKSQISPIVSGGYTYLIVWLIVSCKAVMRPKEVVTAHGVHQCFIAALLFFIFFCPTAMQCFICHAVLCAVYPTRWFVIFCLSSEADWFCVLLDQIDIQASALGTCQNTRQNGSVFEFLDALLVLKHPTCNADGRGRWCVPFLDSMPVAAVPCPESATS